MESNLPFFIVVPVRGITVRCDNFKLEDLNERHWIFIGPEQFAELNNAQGRSNSLLGNLEHIWNRLAPSSLLLVRYYENERTNVWDERRADLILASINIALLQNDISAKYQGPENWPSPVFRARYKEYCELPLSFDFSGTKSSGHTSKIGLLSPPGISGITNNDIEIYINSSPPVLRKIIEKDSLNKREIKLRDASVGILQAFDTVTTGAFVSQIIGMAEMLIDSQSSESSNNKLWEKRIARMSLLSDGKTNIPLEQIRHSYVHAGNQPKNDLPAFCSLAFGVQIWSAMAELLYKYDNYDEVIRLLDIIQISSKSEISDLKNLDKLIPLGIRKNVKWIDKFMSEKL